MALTKASFSMIDGAVFNVFDYGAVGDGVANDTAAIQAAVDAARATNGGTVYFPAGTYLVTTTIDLYQGLAKNIVIRGAARNATTIATANDIVVFQHAETCVFQDFTISQTGTAKTGRAFSTPIDKQAAYCVYERIFVLSFKYGIWWRYSLWCSVRDVRFNGCACGVKLSRNQFPDDQTNPAAPGSWNVAPGFFHNQNTFDNVLCNGGEVGIWGTVNGNVFSNVTCQNQSSSSGASNVVLPVGQAGTGLWLQNAGGASTSTFGAQANNIVNYYTEFTRQPIILDYVRTSIGSVYYQGGASSDKYPQAIKITGGVVNATSCDNTGSDWFTYKMVATDAIIYGNPSAGTTSAPAYDPAAYSLANTTWYQTGATAATTVQSSHTGAITIPIIATMDNENTYSVEVLALYNGSSVRSARFQVAFYNSSVAARVISDAGNSTDITCTTSGSTLNINTTGSLAYVLTATAVQNRKLGKFPYYG